MNFLIIKRSVMAVAALMIIGLALPEIAESQPRLERISVSERTDGLGYVMRFHLTERIDSFSFAQIEPFRVQVLLFHDTIETAGYHPPDESTIVEWIDIVELDGETGFDLNFRDDETFIASFYRDINQTDLLLSLERMSSGELQTSPLIFNTDDSNLEREERADLKEDNQRDDYDEIETYQDNFTVADEKLTKRFLDGRNSTTLLKLMPGDPAQIYIRGVTLGEDSLFTPTFLTRPDITALSQFGSHPWENRERYHYTEHQTDTRIAYRIFSPEFYISNNSELPMGQNDGALWQGRGTNYSITGGAGIQYGPFTAVLKPVITYSENREFERSPYPQLNGLSAYAEPLMNSDIPQQFGESSISDFDLGDSFIQLDYKGFATGVSNQRIWTGPAVYNPLILSYNAPGFLHGFIGTSEPFQFRYGAFETKWFWGGLKESTFFDDDPSNNDRYISGLTVNYSPSFIEGLHLGFTKVAYAYYPENGLNVSDVLLAFRMSQSKNVSNPDKAYHSMKSVYARWVFPVAEFELYGEWGRNDNKRKLRDILAEPELNRGYVFGFIKSFSFSDKHKLLFNTEFTNLENSNVTSQQRDFNTWYEHDVIRQGFTHRGQVLGAAIGPGSSTQVINLSYYQKRGMVGISVQREVMYNDRFHRYKNTYKELHPYPEYWFMIGRQMTQMNYGLHAILFLPYGLELQLDYQTENIDNQYNRYYRDVTNNQFQLSLRYTFDRLFK